MKLFRKTLVVALAVIMLIALAAPASAAAKATAATMKLESKSGTVTITKSTGKAVTYKEGMNLYNGYTVTTGAKSYANISIDGTKIMKVDASSSISIKKSGKKLALYVNSGSACFNVTKKLAGDESMSVQTSTMTAGIRGTFLTVNSTVDESGIAVSKLNLIEGSTDVVFTGADGTPKTVSLTPGLQMNVSPVEIEPSVTQLTPGDIPAFAAVAIAEDPALQARIESTGVLSVADVIKDAQQRLEETEKKQEELQKRIEESIKNEVVKPEAPKPVAPVGGGGGSTPSTPSVPYGANDTYQILDGNNKFVSSGVWDGKVAFPEGTLAEGCTVQLLKNVGSEENTIADLIDVTAGQTVTLDLNGKTLYGCIEIYEEKVVQPEGEPTPAPIITPEGELTIIDSKGTGKIINNAAGVNTVSVHGKLTVNGGSIEQHAPLNNAYAVMVSDFGTFTLDGGTLKNTQQNVPALKCYTDATVSIVSGKILAENSRAFDGVTDNDFEAAATLDSRVNSSTISGTASQTSIVFTAYKKPTGDAKFDVSKVFDSVNALENVNKNDIDAYITAVEEAAARAAEAIGNVSEKASQLTGSGGVDAGGILNGAAQEALAALENKDFAVAIVKLTALKENSAVAGIDGVADIVNGALDAVSALQEMRKVSISAGITLFDDCVFSKPVRFSSDVTITGSAKTLAYTGTDPAKPAIAIGGSGTEAVPSPVPGASLFLEKVNISSAADATLLYASANVTIIDATLTGNGGAGKPVVKLVTPEEAEAATLLNVVGTSTIINSNGAGTAVDGREEVVAYTNELDYMYRPISIGNNATLTIKVNRTEIGELLKDFKPQRFVTWAGELFKNDAEEDYWTNKITGSVPDSV